MLRKLMIDSFILLFLLLVLAVGVWAIYLRAPDLAVGKDGHPISISELERSIIWIAVAPTEYELNGTKYQSEKELVDALKAFPRNSFLAIKWAGNASDVDGKQAVVKRLEKLRLAIKEAGLSEVPEIGMERFQ
jgi:hypothetical protein